MNVGRKNSSRLTPKMSARAVSSVGDFGGKNKYISTWKGWSCQNLPSRSFENAFWCWTGSIRCRVFSWTRNSFFSLVLTCNTNPPRQEADRWSKSKYFEILLKSMQLFWPEPRSDECHFLSLELLTLCYARMVLPLLEQLTQWTRDRVKLLQSPYFFRPSSLPTGILYSPQFCSYQETKMAVRRIQRPTSTISRKNRGLWTVYSCAVICWSIHCNKNK